MVFSVLAGIVLGSAGYGYFGDLIGFSASISHLGTLILVNTAIGFFRGSFMVRRRELRLIFLFMKEHDSFGCRVLYFHFLSSLS